MEIKRYIYFYPPHRSRRFSEANHTRSRWKKMIHGPQVSKRIKEKIVRSVSIGLPFVGRFKYSILTTSPSLLFPCPPQINPRHFFWGSPDSLGLTSSSSRSVSVNPDPEKHFLPGSEEGDYPTDNLYPPTGPIRTRSFRLLSPARPPQRRESPVGTVGSAAH